VRPARRLSARYAGTCADCGEPISVGEPIDYRKPDAVHADRCTLPDTPTTTTRERMEARAEKREEWAEARAGHADRELSRSRELADMIPMGQPILVGHHSEGRHRRDLDRIDGGMRRGVEHHRAAQNHESKAEGIRSQLARSIYDDDPDALDRLAEKLAKLEAQRAEVKAHNARVRKERPCNCPDDCACHSRWRTTICGCNEHPTPPYVLQNLGGEITRTRQRIARLTA
jgi:hypothetical protein